MLEINFPAQIVYIFIGKFLVPRRYNYCLRPLGRAQHLFGSQGSLTWDYHKINCGGPIATRKVKSDIYHNNVHTMRIKTVIRNNLVVVPPPLPL